MAPPLRRQWESFHYCEVHPGVFTAQECSRIMQMRAGEGMSGHLPTARECRLFWIFPSPDNSWLFERMRERALWWNEGYGFQLDPMPDAFQLARYEVGERYDWHMDLGPGPGSLRRATMVVELAPADDGGGLEVFYSDSRNGRLGMSPGDVAIFPSFIMHRAAAVVRGARWSLTCWLLGDRPLS